MVRRSELLVVDDDKGQFELFRALIHELDLPHNCYYAPNGAVALDFLNRRPPFEDAPKPHIVLLDLNMPVMNGAEFLQIVKKDERFRSIPIIMFSASDSIQDVDSCYSEHANAYIRKPTDLISNLNVIRELDRFWFGTVKLQE